MKKSVLAAALLLGAAAVSGCSRGAGTEAFAPEESSLYLMGDGTVASASVESYEADYYSAEELKADVENALEEFNGAAESGDGEENGAVLKECTMEEGFARIIIEFPDPEEYLRFAEAYPEEDGEGQLKTLDIVPVPDGVTKGYLVGASFKDAKGNTVEYNEITKQNRLSVAAVEGPASIYLEGGVRYYSEGAVLEGDRIQTPEEGICYLVFQ